MTDRTASAIRQWIPLIGTFLALGATWATLQSEVKNIRETKVERTEYERLMRLVERVDDRTQRMERFMCRGRTEDLGCQQ